MRYYPEIKEKRASEDKVRGFWGMKIPKMSLYNYGPYRSLCERIRNFDRKNGRMMPGVEQVIKNKKEIIEKIILGEIDFRCVNGVLMIEDASRKRVAALFHKSELLDLDKSREYFHALILKRENMRTILRKVYEGNLKNSDIPLIIEVFGENDYTKVIIYYNDLMEANGTPKKKLDENEDVGEMRERLEEFEKIREKRKSYIKLLRSLEKKKFVSVEAFHSSLRSIDCLEGFMKMDWRDRPYIEKYAVGDNVKIKNPLRGIQEDPELRYLKLEDSEIRSKRHLEKISKSPISLSLIALFRLKSSMFVSFNPGSPFF